MKYVIDIPKYVVDKTKKILAKGEYETLTEFIIAALENQIILEEGEKIGEDIFAGILKTSESMQIRTQENGAKQDFSKWLKFVESINIKTIAMPEISDLEYPNTVYSNQWLWGQINRIFPVKVASRIVANMELENGGFVRLKDFHEKAGEIARRYGIQLLKIDTKLKRKRNERVSTALPIGTNVDKAILRFSSHFLANRRADGILDGAMVRLKFVNIQESKEKEKMIGLTNEGLEFARLRNPILDENIELGKTISDEEADFYLEHIRKNVPEELNPFLYILRIINSGAQSVTQIDKELKNIKQDWTDIVVTTQRSGTLGRMNEVGILDKNMSGTRVVYWISEKGKSFFNKLENITNNKKGK